MVDGFSKLPRYVLREGAESLGLTSLSGPDSAPVSSIYGFADKVHYDAYLRNSPGSLTPYPLVRGFLQNRIDLEPCQLQLVVLDATDRHQQMLFAATMQSIVEAMDLKQDSVSVSHTLALVGSSNSYRVTACSHMTDTRSAR